MNTSSPENTQKTDKQDESFVDVLKKYSRYWYWYVLGAMVGLFGAFMYLRYTVPSFQTQATVLLKDEKNETSAIALSGLDQNNFILGNGRNEIFDELTLMKSKRVVSRAVEALQYHISYIKEGRVIDQEVYDNTPVRVQFAFRSGISQAIRYTIVIVDDVTYQVWDTEENLIGEFNFGKKVELPFGSMTVVPNNPEGQLPVGESIVVNYRPIEMVTMQLQNQLSLQQMEGSSRAVNIGLTSETPDKAEAFILELIKQFNIESVMDQNQVSEKTSDFINTRLDLIAQELDSVEQNKAAFKSGQAIVSVESEAAFVGSKKNEIVYDQLDIASRINLIEGVIAYVNSAPKDELLPANLGVSSSGEGEGGMASIEMYNQLLLEKNRLLKGSTPKNPVVINLNEQIEETRENIVRTLQSQLNTLELNYDEVASRRSRLTSEVRKVPALEKSYIDIERQRAIKEELYLFLLQRREETAISLAATEDKAKIINDVYTSGRPVSPNRNNTYVMLTLLGFALPVGVVYLIFMFDTKVNSSKDVRKVLPEAPLVGQIPKLKKGEDELIAKNDRSVLAESFRMLRTNLQFLFSAKNKENGKIVYVTSTVKGEGKTLVSTNLALTLAHGGSKVLLVGADIRNPQLQRYMDKGYRTDGLVDYLVQPEAEISKFIQSSSGSEHLSILLSGTIPPNPAELLMGEKIGLMFEDLVNTYEYIIVDTAPLLLVTDTLLIQKYADTTVYVIRSGYTDKRMLDFPADNLREGKLKDVAFVLNDLDFHNYGYGSKYGYYSYSYLQDDRTFWQRMFGKG